MGEVELLSTLLSARFDHALTRFTGVNETTNRQGGQSEVNASVTLSALVSFQKETDMNHPGLLLMKCTNWVTPRGGTDAVPVHDHSSLSIFNKRRFVKFKQDT